MTWQKSLFFCGAALLLSACSNATAPSEPTAQLRSTDGRASLLTDSVTVQSGYYVRGGTKIGVGTIFKAP